MLSLGIFWPNYYGRANIGSIKGVSSTVMVEASAFGPLSFAIAYDWFGGYQEVLYAMMLFPLIGMVFAFISQKPVKDQMKSQKQHIS